MSNFSPNPDQPRKHFDADGLKELSESIKEQGVLQPIIVNKSDDGYLIVAGERRWRASALAGIQSVPVLVKQLSAEDVLKVALIENIQRRDLDPIEEALAYKRLLEQHSLTQENLAESLGKNRATIANSLRLLKLPNSILEMIGKGTLSAGHAKAILTLDDQASMEKLADSVVKQGLSVRDAEARARSIKRAMLQEEQTNDGSVDIPQDLATRQVEDRLARLWVQKSVLRIDGVKVGSRFITTLLTSWMRSWSASNSYEPRAALSNVASFTRDDCGMSVSNPSGNSGYD